MNNKQAARRIYRALEGIDPELLYDARAYRTPKLRPYLRYAAAAVIVLAVICTALILSAQNAVKSILTVDADYGVTLELNAGNRVVRAASAASRYDLPAENCRRMDARAALAQLLDSMAARGGLNENADTLLIGATNDDRDAADRLIDSLDTGTHCLIRVIIDERDEVKKLAQKRRITLGKATLLARLSDTSLHIPESRLFRLSANDLALLIQSRGITPDDTTVSGTPGNGGYLSEKAVTDIAVSTFGNTPDSIRCELDSDGFHLVYSVLLYSGDSGSAYIIGAASGTILSEFHGSALAVQTALDKAHEQFAAVSDSTPPQQYTPIQTQVTANTPTQAPSAASSAPTVPVPEPSAAATTQKPASTDKPAEATAAPTEAPAVRRNYLSASQWDATPDLGDIRIIVSAGADNALLSAASRYGAHLIPEREDLAAYLKDEPALSKGLEAHLTDDFDYYALATVEVRERYANENLNTVIFFVKGDTLYAGVFTHTVNSELIPGERDMRYAFLIPKGELKGVDRLKTVLLSYDDVFGSLFESMYFRQNYSLLSKRSWCAEPPENIYTGKYKVDVDLRLFNDTLLSTYPRDVTTSDNENYDHTAWLIRDAAGLTAFRQSVDKKIAGQKYPSDTYMLTHSLLVTTYVERYNLPCYFVTAWKKDGVLYVGFTDEHAWDSTRKPLSSPNQHYVKLGLIELESEQIKDVDRIEIVHLSGQNGKHGWEYLPVEPWD